MSEETTYLLVWEDLTLGEVRAVYSTEAEAVEQAMHDMERGKEIQRVQEHPSGTILWSRDQLKEKLFERHG